MRYELDANGYVLHTYFGGYSGNCTEYTGTVPNGYTDLIDWSENAIINAYYIDEDGNLILDADRLADLEDKIELDTIDNTPVLHKDLYGTNNVLDTQYQKATATGEVIEITDVKKINPKVTFTNIECYKFSKLDIVTQGKQMLDNNAKTETIAGVTFTRNLDSSITLNGTSTDAIEYTLSGGNGNIGSLFALKKHLNYYLNLGGLSCIMKYYDGTTNIVYEGSDGVIKLPENKEVTQVAIKIPKGTTFSNKKIYPMLNRGTTAGAYEQYKAKKLTIDFSEYISEALFPANDLYPADDLYPSGTKIEYIHIEDGKVYISVDGVVKYLTIGNVNLFDGYNLVYTMQETNIEMEYCIDLLSVDDLEFLQGKATTTNKFKILADGSVEAHNGYFSGTVNATDGNFTGTINATGGSFTGTIETTNGKFSGSITGSTITGSTINLISNGQEDARLTITDATNSECEFRQSARLIRWIGTQGGVFELWNVHKTPLLGMRSDSKDLPYSCGFSPYYLNFNMFENGEVTETPTSVGVSGITTPKVTQTSREESKKNFELYTDALKEVKKTDIYKYNLKTEKDGSKKHLGFVIGKKYNYSNEITAVDDEGKEIGVDSYSMTSLCLQAIKELLEKVETLENKIKELESDK